MQNIQFLIHFAATFKFIFTTLQQMCAYPPDDKIIIDLTLV